MILSPGDVIKVLCGQTGYAKYHLYVGLNNVGSLMFLYLNSENGFKGDLVLNCAELPFLPKSATGETVLSFTAMPRFTAEKLEKLGAVYHGRISTAVADKVRAHCPSIRTFGKAEKALLLAGAALM